MADYCSHMCVCLSLTDRVLCGSNLSCIMVGWVVTDTKEIYLYLPICKYGDTICHKQH